MIHAICVDRLMDVVRTHHPICPTSMLLEHSNVSNVSLDREPMEIGEKSQTFYQILRLHLHKTRLGSSTKWMYVSHSITINSLTVSCLFDKKKICWTHKNWIAFLFSQTKLLLFKAYRIGFMCHSMRDYFFGNTIHSFIAIKQPIYVNTQFSKFSMNLTKMHKKYHYLWIDRAFLNKLHKIFAIYCLKCERWF